VNFHAHAVAEAVAEIGTVTGVLDDLPGGGVHVVAGGAGLGGGDARQLGLQHDVVDLLHLLGDAAHGHGAGHVRAIALIDATEVHGHEVAVLDLPVGGHGVGHTAVGTAGHDGVKGHILRASGQHQVLQPGGDLLLGDAGPDLLDDLVQSGLGDALGGDHPLDLLLVLALAQGDQQLRGGHQLAVQLLGIVAIVRHGHVRILEAQLLHMGLFHGGVDQVHIGVGGVGHGDLGVLHLVVGGLDIAGVGEIEVPLPGHQGHAVGAGGVEAGGIEAVGLAGQQHTVQLIGRQLFRNFRKMVHNQNSFQIR